jgi:hypothetical protein
MFNGKRIERLEKRVENLFDVIAMGRSNSSKVAQRTN